MEALVEISPHERERGKPMPNAVHGSIQANISFELKLRYRGTHRIMSEVSLATTPYGTTPDVVVYPNFQFDYEHEPAKRSDPPLTCIEITGPPSRSASQSTDEMVTKTNAYFRFGVKSCWIVIPILRAIMVFDKPGHYEFFHHDDTLRDPQTGFELPLSGVFV